jgi:hypothetical protein
MLGRTHSVDGPSEDDGGEVPPLPLSALILPTIYADPADRGGLLAVGSSLLLLPLEKRG